LLPDTIKPQFDSFKKKAEAFFSISRSIPKPIFSFFKPLIFRFQIAERTGISCGIFQLIAVLHLPRNIAVIDDKWPTDFVVALIDGIKPYQNVYRHEVRVQVCRMPIL